MARGLRLISQLPWRSDQLFLFGDTLLAFGVAAAIGTDCILLAHGHHSTERLTESGAPVVHSLRELVPLLEKA